MSSRSPTLLVALTLAALTRAAPTTAQPTVAIPPASVGSAGPAGLFARAVVSFSSGTVEVRTLLFLEGGVIVRTHPFGGGDAFDLARCNPDMCGRWERAGHRIAVRWNDGRTDEWSYAPGEDYLDVDGDRYRAARPLAPAELVGTWADTPGNVYTFAADGGFTVGANGRATPGRYTLSGRTLSLAFGDGTTRVRTLFAVGSGDPAGMIALDGEAFRRR